MTNVERLQQAGLVQTHIPLTDDEIKSVNALSPAEIDALISVRAKLEILFSSARSRRKFPSHGNSDDLARTRSE